MYCTCVGAASKHKVRVGSDPFGRIFCTYVLDIIGYVLRMGSTRLFESSSLIGSQILLRVSQGIGGEKSNKEF